MPSFSPFRFSVTVFSPPLPERVRKWKRSLIRISAENPVHSTSASGFGMMILLLAGRRRSGRQAGGSILDILDHVANRSDKLKGNMGLPRRLSSRRRKKSFGMGKVPLSLTGSCFSPMLRPRSSSSWKRQALGALHPFLIRILRKHPHGAPTDQAGRDAKFGSP